MPFREENGVFKNLHFPNKIEHCIFGFECQYGQGILRVYIRGGLLLVMELGQLASLSWGDSLCLLRFGRLKTVWKT